MMFDLRTIIFFVALILVFKFIFVPLIDKFVMLIGFSKQEREFSALHNKYLKGKISDEEMDLAKDRFNEYNERYKLMRTRKEKLKKINKI